MNAANGPPAVRRTVLRMCALPAMVAVFAATAETPETQPARFIAAAAEALATAVNLQRPELETNRRRRDLLVDELLLPKFDLQTACRLILREHWNAAPESDRQRFVAAFYAYLLASHGDALSRFGHETLTVLAEQEPAIGASTRVRTRLRLADGDVFDVDFYLRLDERGWRIVDVIVEGISYVRTYRTDFGAEIRRHGLAALTARLESLAAE